MARKAFELAFAKAMEARINRNAWEAEEAWEPWEPWEPWDTGKTREDLEATE